MPTLTIRHKRHWYEPKLPHAVFLNGYYAGTLKGGQLHMCRIFKFFSSERIPNAEVEAQGIQD